MKRGLVASALVGVVLIGTAVHTKATEDWQNLDVIQVNVEKPHTTMVAYPNQQDAISFNRENSSNFQLLNGEWKFNWAPKPADRPLDFYKEQFNDSRWGNIPVPSNWEIQGHGTAVYSNATYPFGKNEPYISADDNPVGSYRRTFNLPQEWKDKDVFITFDGVGDAFYLWINGHKVGYNQGSRTPAEFNISKYLKKGKNIIAVEVYRWCDGSYLEDQDFWRLSGIFRDVYLHARSSTYVRDVRIVTDLDDDYNNAVLSVDLELAGKINGDVSIELLSPEGKTVYQENKRTDTQLSFKQVIRNPAKWTNETPALYTLLVTTKDNNGKTLEVVPQRIGFREVDIKDMVFRVNGKPLKLKGINRHETHPELGQVVTRESIIRDIKLCKENNINAIRTSHYPNVPLFYDLCDEYGIWVMDEANIETHGYGTPYGFVEKGRNQIANNPAWEASHLNRVQRMAARDKNHASIIIWSLGNEAGIGPNHDATYAFLKNNYPYRPVHYQGEQRPGLPASDFHSKMYSAPNWTSATDKHLTGVEKTSILCEYSHAMGNSNGNLKEYWDVIYDTPTHAGAFVWDWMDQGMSKPIPDQFKKNIGIGPVKDHAFAYGGWEKHNYPHSGNFCMNGLIGSDWTERPGLKAVKYIHHNVVVNVIDATQGHFIIENRYDFSNLQEVVDGKWAIFKNGRQIAIGAIDELDVEPSEKKAFFIGLPAITSEDGDEFFINLTFHAKATYSPLVKAGHELAFEQFPMTHLSKTTPSAVKPTLQPLQLKDKPEMVILTGAQNLLVQISKKSGFIEKYEYKGKVLINKPAALDFWRVELDNEKGLVKSYKMAPKWKWALHKNKISSFKVTENSNGSVTVDVDLDLVNVNAVASMNYTIFGDGEVVVSADFYLPELQKREQYMRKPISKTASLSDVPLDETSLIPEIQKYKKLAIPHRIGMEFQLPKEMQNIAWYGRGPWATYADRKFERIGLYSGTVDDQWVEYSRPQENGNKTDVRWVSLTDDQGNGLRFVAESSPLSVGAKNYDKYTMETSDYSFKMHRSEFVHLNIDHAQMGVGGVDSWKTGPLKSYLLTDRNYSYRYRIVPLVHIGVKEGD